jgi:DNA-binding transcriptional regulator YhcF (GntR family)
LSQFLKSVNKNTIDKPENCTIVLVQQFNSTKMNGINGNGGNGGSQILDGWQVEYRSGIPVYRQIINQVCAAVTGNTVKAGDQLPTIRALSERLNVNPNTVAKAYRELELKGIILSERGSGSFIQAQSSSAAAPQAIVAATAPEAGGNGGKKDKLNKLYQRLLADVASNGLTEHEFLNFIKENNPGTL